MESSESFRHPGAGKSSKDLYCSYSRSTTPSHLDYWKRLEKLSIMSLQRRRERYILLHMWKILNGAVSNDLRIQFISRSRTGFKAVVPPLRGGASTSTSKSFIPSKGSKHPCFYGFLTNHQFRGTHAPTPTPYWNGKWILLHWNFGAVKIVDDPVAAH